EAAQERREGVRREDDPCGPDATAVGAHDELVAARLEAACGAVLEDLDAELGRCGGEALCEACGVHERGLLGVVDACEEERRVDACAHGRGVEETLAALELGHLVG